MKARTLSALLSLLAGFLLAGKNPAAALTFDDRFAGQRLIPLWESYLPKKGATAQLTANGLELETPATGTYNHWTNVDSAPQVRMDAPNGDFTLETEIPLSGLPKGNYHAGLFVMFGKNDLYEWGVYQNSTQLKAERSGSPKTLTTIPTAKSISLRIRKFGSVYYFLYKTPSATNWRSAFSERTENVPLKIGVMLKTWQTLDVKADFREFILTSDQFKTDLSQGWIRATITDESGNPISGPWLIVRNAQGEQIGGIAKAASAGQATTFNLPGGTYVVKSVHPHYDSSEEKTVTVTPGRETALDLQMVHCPDWKLTKSSKDLTAAGAPGGWLLLPGASGSAETPRMTGYRQPIMEDYTPSGDDPILQGTWLENARVPGDYGQRQIHDDSVFWYRLDLDFPEAYSRFIDREWLLSGFNIDDEDVTYLNGSLIGQTRAKNIPESWLAVRNYTIPAGSFKAPGRNVIAIQGYQGPGGAGMTNSGPLLQASSDSDSDVRLNLADPWGGPADGVTVTLTSLGGAYRTQAFATKQDGALFRFLPEGEYLASFDREVGLDPSVPQRVTVTSGTATTLSLIVPLLPVIDLRSDALEAAGNPGWLFMPTDAAQSNRAASDNAPAGPGYPDDAEDATYGQDWFAGTPVPEDLGWGSPKDKSRPIEDNSYFWYRLHLNLPLEWRQRLPGRNLLLTNFQADDSDWTFFNGQLIGQTDNDWQKVRSYVIPYDAVKWGADNVIAIKGYQGTGGAGIFGDLPFSLTFQPKDRATAPGDLNGDGATNLNDALLALQAALGLKTLDADGLAAGDLNGDGKIDVGEATKILQAAAGLGALP
jgi:hypothetical protein